MGFHGWALGLDLSIEADQIKKSVNWGAKKKKKSPKFEKPAASKTPNLTLALQPANLHLKI